MKKLTHMKTKNYFCLLAIIFILNACKKDPVTTPVHFTATTYENLGAYNSIGVPDNMLKDTLSTSLLSFIDSILPDGKNLTLSHPELFSSSAIGDVRITQPSSVYITFVSEGCANQNSIAFYTYPSNQPPLKATDIKEMTYVFPNAGFLTGLLAGDKVKVGQFAAGTSVGFVLMENAWISKNATLNNDAVHFCTNDALNPEVDPNLKKHAVLINYAPENKLLISFEDKNRTDPSCDNDFNDVVIYSTTVPSN